MQTVLMQHVWWKSLNPVNTLFFVIEVWMKVPRQVHGDGAERWRNQEEETIRAESRHRLRLLRCLTRVNERGRSTHVWPVHTRLQLSQVVIILRDSSLKLQLSIRHFTASTAELHRISASGLWPGGLSSPRMSSSCHLKKDPTPGSAGTKVRPSVSLHYYWSHKTVMHREQIQSREKEGIQLI